MRAATTEQRRRERRPSSAGVVLRDVLRSSGQPLDAATRAFMEPRFGHDFSQVRVHADGQAAESAHALDAMAYSVGRDTVFDAGAYAPHTAAGRRLLAHELAHVIQQGGGHAAATRVSSPGDAAERDADRAAADAMAGRDVHLAASADAGTLHRQPLPGLVPRPAPRIARLTGSELLDGFALESATLTEDHKRRLAILAVTLLDLLREYPGGGVRVTGHTDATGDDAFNEGLGQRRADAVADSLIEAGVPASALMIGSEGESRLRIETARADPRNRRVAVRFEPARRGRAVEPAPPSGESTDKGTTDVDLTPRDPALPFDCSARTDCSATPGSFERQPEGLRRLIRFDDPAAWFDNLDPETSFALRAIYNRLCKYGLLCQVYSILYTVDGETPAKILDRQFKVPGATPSVYFSSPVNALFSALLSSGHFCLAHGAGAAAHPGQTTLREISGSDSLHISLGPGEQFDAHIDRYSPAPEHSGSIWCSNAPTAAAVGHIGRELIPEMIPKAVDRLTGWMKDIGPLSMLRNFLLTATKGIQVLPEPEPSRPEAQPEPPRQDAAPPPVIQLTWRGPAKKNRKHLQPDVPPLPPEVELRLEEEIGRRVPADALNPPGAEQELARLKRAAEMAGPDEEDKLVALRDAAGERFKSLADPHLVALDMARRMDQASKAGHSAFVVPLGVAYSGLTPADHKYLVGQVRDIARLTRLLLDGRGGGVRKVYLIFGEDVMVEVDF